VTVEKLETRNVGDGDCCYYTMVAMTFNAFGVET
jgi:hypothetical protein